MALCIATSAVGPKAPPVKSIPPLCEPMTGDDVARKHRIAEDAVSGARRQR
jgi:hypothetical protein